MPATVTTLDREIAREERQRRDSDRSAAHRRRHRAPPRCRSPSCSARAASSRCSRCSRRERRRCASVRSALALAFGVVRDREGSSSPPARAAARRLDAHHARRRERADVLGRAAPAIASCSTCGRHRLGGRAARGRSGRRRSRRLRARCASLGPSGEVAGRGRARARRRAGVPARPVGRARGAAQRHKPVRQVTTDGRTRDRRAARAAATRSSALLEVGRADRGEPYRTVDAAGRRRLRPRRGGGAAACVTAARSTRRRFCRRGGARRASRDHHRRRVGHRRRDRACGSRRGRDGRGASTATASGAIEVAHEVGGHAYALDVRDGDEVARGGRPCRADARPARRPRQQRGHRRPAAAAHGRRQALAPPHRREPHRHVQRRRGP